MEAIRHNVVIKTSPEKIFQAITTKEGIEGWWCKNTVAKPEVGFVNIFSFGQSDRIEMKVTELSANKKVKWECIHSNDREWPGTNVSFELEAKDGKTLLRFTHGNWKEATDLFAVCNFHWGLFLKSLKSFCETGKGEPQ